MERNGVAWALALSLAACNIRGHDPAGGLPPPVEVVEVTPGEATLLAGQSVQLGAVARGPGRVPQAVTWSIRCLSGCDTIPAPYRLGSVSPDGLFTAPIDNAGAVTLEVVALSVAGSARGTATIQVAPAAFVLTPASPATVLGGQLQFQVVWNGQVDPPMAWRCERGTIDGAGRYQAPDAFIDPVTNTLAWEDTITARHLASGQEKALRVQLRFRTPVLTSVSGPAAAGDTVTLEGSGLDAGLSLLGTTWAVFSDGAGGEVSMRTEGTDASRTVTVPFGAASGPVYVELRADRTVPLPAAASNAVAFERRAMLRLHADRPRLTAGESTTIRVAVLGAPASLPVTLEADVGGVDGLTYTAPAEVASPGWANLRACVRGTSACGGLSIPLAPVRVSPEDAVVPGGGVVQLGAVAAGAAVALPFSIAAGGGLVSPDGRYQATLAPEDAGPAWLQAGSGAAAVAVQVGVSGPVPGLLARRTEPGPVSPGPFTDGIPWGARALAVSVAGGRAYLRQSAAAGSNLQWIDVLDVSDPTRPAWLGAVEARDGSPQQLRVAGGLLVSTTMSGSGDGSGSLVLDAYDLSGALPSRIGSSSVAVAAFQGGSALVSSPVIEDGAAYLFGPATRGSAEVPLRIVPLSAGAMGPPIDHLLPRPTDPAPSEGLLAATASGGRAYLTYYSVIGPRLAAWDVSAAPARLLGTVPTQNHRAEPLAVTTALGRRRLVVDGECFDLAGELPVPVACTFEPAAVAARAFEGTRLVSGSLRVDDHADPAAPRRIATVDAPWAQGAGALVGGHYFSPEMAAGLAVYDLGPGGGPRLAGEAANTSYIDGLHAGALQGGFLYTVAWRGSSAMLSAWDLSTSPPTFRSATWTYEARTLAVGGDLLLLGLPAALETWSLADPAAPARVGGLPLDPITLALDGSTAWAGTAGGDLVAIDVAVPSAPLVMARLPLGALPQAIRVIAPGLLAVATATADGLRGDLLVVDGTTPAAPAIVGAAGLALPAIDLALDGSLAVVATTSELCTVELSDPLHPVPLAAVPIPPTWIVDGRGTPHRPATLGLGGGLAWVATGDLFGQRRPWLGGFDLRQPRWPRLVSATVPDWSLPQVTALVVDGTRAYGASWWTGTIAELDLSQPRNVILTLPPAPPRPLGP